MGHSDETKELLVKPEIMIHEITLRVYKNEIVDLIADLTYNNNCFRKEEWSMSDAERLIMAGKTIKNALEE
jgi:hypothetical protein